MLIAIDQGNSDTVFGYYDGDGWSAQWRIPTTNKGSSDYEAQMRLWLLEGGHKLTDIQAVVISSVVPEYKDNLIKFASEYFSPEPLVLGPKVYESLGLELNSPHEIGSDLVANAVAATTTFPGLTCIIVDFGTALTLTCAQANAILGVSIAPGLQTAVKSLFKHTAQLPEVPLELPQSVLGKNTIHAIQSGVLHGYIGLVRNLISEAKKELNTEYKILATGGLSSILKPLASEFDIIDPALTLNGLRVIRERIQS